MDFKNLSEADAMRAASEDLGLPPEFFDRMWAAESGRGKNMRSHAGARGHFQIMPTTQAAWEKRLGRPLDPDNFQDSLTMAHATMKENLARFKDPAKATAAYNGGWKEENWGNPETAAYVPKVLGKALDGTPVQVSPEDIAPAKPASPYSGTAAASAMLAAEGSAALVDQLTPAFAADQKAEQRRQETGVLDVAAAALTDPRVMGTWAILDRINKAPDDPTFDYAANIDKIEGVDWSDEERAWARENVRSLEQAQEYKNRVAYQRQLDTTVYSRASTGENLLGQFAAGMGDPAGWVAGLGTAKAFQLAKISSGALAAAGRGKAAVGAAMLEAGLGEVAYEGALALAGEQKTGEDYLMALGLGVAMQAPFSGGVYRQAVDAQLVQTANDLRNSAAQAQANAWAQGLTPPQQAQTQVAEIDALVQSANVPQTSASVADGVVIPTDLQQAMIQEDTGAPPELAPAERDRPAQAQEGARAAPESVPAIPALVTQENLPELHLRAEQAFTAATAPGPREAELADLLFPELLEDAASPLAPTPVQEASPEQAAKQALEEKKKKASTEAWQQIADSLLASDDPVGAWTTFSKAGDDLFEPGFAVLDQYGVAQSALWEPQSPEVEAMLDSLSDTLRANAKAAQANGTGPIVKEVEGVSDGAGPLVSPVDKGRQRRTAAPAAVTHPQADDSGATVTLANPTKSSSQADWWNPPAGKPLVLGVQDWVRDTSNVIREQDNTLFTLRAQVEAQVELDVAHAIANPKAEPPMAGLIDSAGVLIRLPNGSVIVRHPTNQWDGTQADLPAGKIEPGHNAQSTAIKETWEETGLRVELTHHLVDAVTPYGNYRYYEARVVGGSPTWMGWETQGLTVYPPDSYTNLDELVNKWYDKALMTKIQGASPTPLVPAGPAPTNKTAQVAAARETGSMVETVVMNTETEELRVGWAFDHAKAAKQKANKNNLHTTTIGKLLAKVKKSWVVSNKHVTQFSDVASYLLARMDEVALSAPVYIRRLQKRGYMEPDTGSVVLPDQPAAKLPSATTADILEGMDQYSAETMIHEIVHAATAVSLEAVETAIKAGKKVDPKAKAAYDTLVAVRKQLKAAQDTKEFPGVAYASKNVHELVAQAVSDKATIQALMGLPGKGVESDSALDDFIHAVTSLLGLPRSAAVGTALESTLASIHTLIKFHGTIKDVNGLPIMGAWANTGGKPPSETSQAILRSLLLKSGQKPMTTRTMLDHGLKFPNGWETKIAKLIEGSEWEGMDPLDVPVFFHGAAKDFVTTQGGVIPGKNYGKTIFLATSTNTSKYFAGLSTSGDKTGYVWPMIFAPRKGTLADWRNPEHVAKIKLAIETKAKKHEQADLLTALDTWARTGHWTSADVLRTRVLEPLTDFVAHYESESTMFHGDIPEHLNKAGYSLPNSLGGAQLPGQGTEFLNIALWDQTYLKLIVENDGTFDVGGAPNILSSPPNPIQQSATQVKFAARMYEHAREWVRKNPIDRKRLDVLTKKWGYVLSDGLKLASSNNPILNMVAGLITETTTGAAGRRNTAAIRKELIHKKLMGNALINVEGLYTVWRDKNGGSVIQDFKNGDHRRRFESLVHDELLARRYGTAQTIDPSIRKAADEWEAMFQRALDQQKASGVLGSAYLPETSKGYVPQSLDGGKLAVATKQELDALADHLAEHFAQLYDWSPDFAKQFAPFYISRARRRAMGEKGVDSATMGGNATEAVKDALEEMKLEPSVMTKALAATDRVGGQSQTKKRLDVDLLGTLPNGKRVKDYYVSDVSLLARNYANRTAGTAALTEFGILGWRGVRNLLDSVRTASDKPGELATSEEIEAAERVLAEMLGTPWVGETRSALASGARLTVGLQRLGGLVFTQAAEVWNMTHQLGLSATLKGIASLPRVLGDVRTRKTGGAYKGLLESLETWGGEIGMETYKLQARLDAPDEYLRDYGKSNSLALRLLNAGGQLQAKVSFFQGLMAAQHRMVAEQITRKVLRYAKEGKANDTYLKDMGFDAETIQAIRLGLSASTKFDSRGRVISFDVSKLGSAKLAETFVQSVHRGTAQIIQGTFVGERAAWAHNDWAKLLLQLRTFGLTSVEKQWGRTRMNSGYALAAGMLLGQMALALPIYLARVTIASAGREDQEEFLERNTNPAAVTRALLNYSSLSGLSGDVLDLMTGIAGGWGGQDVAEAIGARQQATSVGGLIPVAGSIDSASRVLSGKTDVHTAIKQLPLSNLWYIAPIINLTKQD